MEGFSMRTTLSKEDERTSEEYLRDLDIEFHERALLANSKCFIKRRNNFSSQKANENTDCYKCGKRVIFLEIVFLKRLNLLTNHQCQTSLQCQKDYKTEYKKIKAKLALLEASPSTSKNPKTSQSKNKSLVAKTFNWDEEEVSDDEELAQVKVLMALADDELTVGKNHACNDEWIDITMTKVNILPSMDKDFYWQNYLKYINVDLKDDLLVLKQAKLEAVTFQIQNTELTKLNHALQEQLKEERKINEKWLTSSKKVSQFISEQIPNQKKKILGGELLTEPSSKKVVNEKLFIPSSMRVLRALLLHRPSINNSASLTDRIRDVCLRQELLEYMGVHVNDASESLKPSWGKMCTLILSHQLPGGILESAQDTDVGLREADSETLSKVSQDVKSKSQNTESSKSGRRKPLQKPMLKCELCHYTNHSTDDCYKLLYYMRCKKEDHRTSNHDMYTASLKRSENYTAQPYQYASPSKQILKAKANPFPPCTHCGFNDHRPDDCRNYRKCEIFKSYDHFTSRHNHVILVRGGALAESSQPSESSHSSHK
ncbi:hypothetical protein Tco_1368241 [Tanacetum coccineum]